MKKIVIAARGIRGLTGTTTGILEHTRRLANLGYRVDLYGERLDIQRVKAAGGIPQSVWRPPFGRHFRRRWFARRFDRFVRRHRYDFIIGHGDIYTQDVLSMHDCVHRVYEEINGRPIDRETSVSAVHRKILEEKNFSFCIANSQLMKEDLTRRFAIAPDKIRVIHPGYDPERFGRQFRDRYRLPIRQSLGLIEQDILVGIITSGAFRKRGVEILLQALPKLAPKNRVNLHIIVIGRDDQTPEYLDLARSAGMGERIRFFPATNEIHKYFHALDIFAYPARFEEFGQSVQEAMVSGIPVLTSRLVGASEIYSDKEGRILLDKPDVEAFAQLLDRLIADSDFRHRCGEWGYKAAKDNTWDRNFRLTMEVFKSQGL